MKKFFALFSILTLCVSMTLVGCGGGTDNKSTKTDTTGKAPPKDSESEKKADDEGKKRDSAAGGEAKTESPPDAP